ncbi:MAG: hypothetical protein ABI759_02260 [Candidatus Solibacter sp.]
MRCKLLHFACAAVCSTAAAGQGPPPANPRQDAAAIVAGVRERIRTHMHDYVTRLPDYTCRITLERFKRLKANVAFELSDRLRLEVAYTGGQEMYSWPGDARFEAGIEDLLPGHGMVSNGSYALHVKNLFLRDVAEFSGPATDICDGQTCLRLEFLIPAVNSGYALSAGGGSAPAPLAGFAWFHPETFDIQRLEVRVDQPPRGVRIASTRETTTYQRARIGDVEFVVPATSELLLRDRNGVELWNRTRFDQYRRYAGSATLTFGGMETPVQSATPAPAAASDKGPATLDADITEEAAIGDPFTVTTSTGAKLTGRIEDMRRTGNAWFVELKLGNLHKGQRLPIKRGTRIR